MNKYKYHHLTPAELRKKKFEREWAYHHEKDKAISLILIIGILIVLTIFVAIR